MAQSQSSCEREPGMKLLYFLREVRREEGKKSLRQMCDEEKEKIILYVAIVNVL